MKNKTIAILGYGIQGQAQAKCFRDSGLNVIIGARKEGSSFEKAKKDSFEVFEIPEAAKKGDILCILLPDMVHKKVFNEQILPHLNPRKTLYFSHGFSIVYKLVCPPKNMDVIMVAPAGSGKNLRDEYLKGRGIPAYTAVWQDASGHAKGNAYFLAKALGCTRKGAGVLECTFEEEVVVDLFGEQAALCGGLTGLLEISFETLTSAGYSPKMAYIEIVRQISLILDLVQEFGPEGMWERISQTAQYGGRLAQKKLFGEDAKKKMHEILEKVRKGKFAKEWIEEYERGSPTLKKLSQEGKNSPLQKIHDQLKNQKNPNPA